VSAGPAQALDAAALDEPQRALRRQAHETLVKVTTDIGRADVQYGNRRGDELMNAVRALRRSIAAGRAVVQEALEMAVLVLSPSCRTRVMHCGANSAMATPVVDERWPEPDARALERATVEVVVQVNGKLRGRVTVPAGADQATVREAALADRTCSASWRAGRCASSCTCPASSPTWSL